jgi:hypothetical protein
MKNLFIGIALGAVAMYVVQGLIIQKPTVTAEAKPTKNILVIPNKHSLSPGEEFSLVIVPEKDTSSRWYYGISLLPPPEMNAQIETAQGRSMFCTLNAPRSDSLMDLGKVKFEVSVDFTDDQGMDQKISDTIRMKMSSDDGDLKWTFEQ